MSVDPNARTSPYIKVPPEERTRRFVSLRWRILTPVIAVLMAVMMCGAYGVSFAFMDSGSSRTQDELIAAGESLAQNAIEVGRTQRTEVDRIAFTQGVPAGIVADDGASLQPLVEPLAALANLDLVVLANMEAAEVIGLERVIENGVVDYAVTTDTEISSIAAVRAVLDGADSSSTIVTVDRRPMLVTAGPVLQDGQAVGVVLVGTDINRVLASVKGGNNIEVALFGGSSVYLGTTFEGVDPLSLDEAVYTDTLNHTDRATFERIDYNDTKYEAVYFPFVIGQTPLGVLGAYKTDTVGGATDMGRRVLSLLFAAIAASICVATYVATGRAFGRLEKVRDTADRLASGENVRTGMKPNDEIGEMGVALDRFAAAAQTHIRQLQSDLRQQRRQLTHLNAILESLPDGIVVQDMEGRVMTMNAQARDYLGAAGTSSGAASLREWTGTLSQRVGELLAPGLYTLDESTEIRVEGRFLRMEAGAVYSIADKRIGTVVTLRDVTAAAMHDAKRDALIEEMATDIHISMSQRAQAAALEAGTKPQTVSSESLRQFAKEISQDARAMQRMITDYRDLTLLKPNELREKQHPVNVTELLMELVEEWRPVASASEVAMNVALPDDDYHILGDEKRLAWALGNVVDNAIRYSNGKGQITVRVKPQEEKSQITFTIEDQGVGILHEDQPHLFTRFFRGKPTTATGEILHVTGAGQGLYMTQRVVEAHGGSIALASAPGQGTHVSVVLPLTADVVLELPPGMHDTQTSVWDLPTHTEIRVGRDTIEK